jgi:hypothetical protein
MTGLPPLLLTDRDLNETALIIEKLTNKYGEKPSRENNNLFFRHLHAEAAVLLQRVER